MIPDGILLVHIANEDMPCIELTLEPGTAVFVRLPKPSSGKAPILSGMRSTSIDFRAEVQRWKSAHADMVKRCAILREREDLPVDRIPAYRELVRLQGIEAELDAMNANFQAMLLDRDEWKQKAMSNEGMADCMHMVRQELIEAGVIDEKVAPMFVANAVFAKFAKVGQLIQTRIDKYDGDMEGADHDEFICAEWACGALRDLLVRFDVIMSGKSAS